MWSSSSWWWGRCWYLSIFCIRTLYHTENQVLSWCRYSISKHPKILKTKSCLDGIVYQSTLPHWKLGHLITQLFCIKALYHTENREMSSPRYSVSKHSTTLKTRSCQDPGILYQSTLSLWNPGILYQNTTTQKTRICHDPGVLHQNTLQY